MVSVPISSARVPQCSAAPRLETTYTAPLWYVHRGLNLGNMREFPGACWPLVSFDIDILILDGIMESAVN